MKNSKELEYLYNKGLFVTEGGDDDTDPTEQEPPPEGD